MKWRAMQLTDLAEVRRIAAEVHPAYPESAAVFAERLQLFARGCWMALAADGSVLGYAITHPALLGQPVPLDSLLQHLPAHADCLYLHDIALCEGARGGGLGAALLQLMQQQAEQLGLPQLALVAVNGSAPYWQRQGFVRYTADAVLAHKLSSYDAAAAYLVLPVTKDIKSH